MPLHIQLRRHIGGEHHILTGNPHSLGQKQFRVAGAVTTAPFLMEDLQNIGIRGGLYGKILFKARIPGKRIL